MNSGANAPVKTAVPQQTHIELIIEPSGGEAAKVEAGDFVQQLDALLQSIKCVADAMDGSNAGRNVIYRLKTLSTNSPAFADIAPELVLGADQVDYGRWFFLFDDALKAIQRGAKELPSYITNKCIDALKALTRAIGSSVHRSRITIDDRETVVVDYQFKTNLFALKIGDRIERGSFIKGMVERMNIHSDNRTFTVYPFIGPESITCKFPAELKTQAMESFGGYARIHGDFHYHWQEKWPFEIHVKSIELLDLPAEIPRWDQLCGALPGATGDMSAEAFVEELRHGG